MTMAVPFFIPESNDSSVSSTTSGEASAASSTQNSPTRPIPIPRRNNNNLESPQLSPIDNEVLVQAFYEALCRCSQGSPMSPQMSPLSPSTSGQFFFPRHMMPSPSTSTYSPSTSTYSSPRHSFRVPRRRLNSEGSYTHEEEDEDEIQQHDEALDWQNHYQQREELEEFSGRVPEPKSKKFKHADGNHKTHGKQKSENKSKITSFVISALQFVIDTLR